MRRILKFVYWIAGLACIGYYFLLGYAARFGLDMSWIWLAGGGILIVAGLTCRGERIPGWIRIAWRTLLCAGLALVVVLESMAVSYTHLDVYKRQGGADGIAHFKLIDLRLAIDPAGAVSYTHLDVYKRQMKGYFDRPKERCPCSLT